MVSFAVPATVVEPVTSIAPVLSNFTGPPCKWAVLIVQPPIAPAPAVTVPVIATSPLEATVKLLPILKSPSAANVNLLTSLVLKFSAPLVISTFDLLAPTSPIVTVPVGIDTLVPNLEAVTLPAMIVSPSEFIKAFSCLSLAP